MFRLFIYLEDEQLKVRKATEQDRLQKPFVWKDALEFELTSSPIMMAHWTSVLPDLDPQHATALVDLVGARFPFSPKHHELQQICPELTFKKTTQEWVFFGGSFNPWHAGHQACLNLLQQSKVCFVIPDRNPLKELREIDPVITVIELCSKIRFHKNQFLAPSFLMDSIKNPTVSWVTPLRQKYPNKKLSLLMGFDGFKGVLSWVKSTELLEALDKIYVVSRLEDEQMQQEALRTVLAVAPKLEVEFLGHHEFEELSSTHERSKVSV